MNKFKVGDVVRNIGEGANKGKLGEVTEVFDEPQCMNASTMFRNSMFIYPMITDIGAQCSSVGRSHFTVKVNYRDGGTGLGMEEDYVVVQMNYVLHYQNPKDIVETFETSKEMEARIRELTEKDGSTAKRESIKVYEIAKTYDVKLETRVIFGGTKVKLTEKAPVKRGRPVGSKNSRKKCPDCGAKVKGNLGLAQHRRWQHGSITKQTA